jgi:hypothetical protein
MNPPSLFKRGVRGRVSFLPSPACGRGAGGEGINLTKPRYRFMKNRFLLSADDVYIEKKSISS